MKPKKSAASAWRLIQKAKLRMRERAMKQHSNATISAQIAKALEAHNRNIANFVLRYKLGITNPKTINTIYSLFAGQRKNFDATKKDIMAFGRGQLTMQQYSARLDARIDQTEATQREAICKTLGREKGEFFWREFQKAWKRK